jgi:hypothetical protein
MNIFTKEYQVDYTDNELIQSVLGGDKIALTTLVEKHQPFIYNLGRFTPLFFSSIIFLSKLRKFYRTKKGQLLLDLDFPCGERGITED